MRKKTDILQILEAGPAHIYCVGGIDFDVKYDAGVKGKLDVIHAKKADGDYLGPNKGTFRMAPEDVNTLIEKNKGLKKIGVPLYLDERPDDADPDEIGDVEGVKEEEKERGVNFQTKEEEKEAAPDYSASNWGEDDDIAPAPAEPEQEPPDEGSFEEEKTAEPETEEDNPEEKAADPDPVPEPEILVGKDTPIEGETVIGRNCVVKENGGTVLIKDSDPVWIAGKAEADIEAASVIVTGMAAGNIRADGDVKVMGSGASVAGSIEGTTVEVDRGTSVAGNITAKSSVEVLGTVDGDIHVTGALNIRSSARVTGAVTSDVLLVEPGAFVSGLATPIEALKNHADPIL